MEIEKILNYSGKLYNYIKSNIYLYENIQFFLAKVEILKKTQNSLKQHFLLNSADLIKQGVKKSNLSNIQNFLTNVKVLKEILDLIKKLSNNPAKYQVTYDLIEKGKIILNNLMLNFSNVSILSSFEIELAKFSNNSAEKIINELILIVKNEIEKLIITNKKSESNNINHQVNEEDNKIREFTLEDQVKLL